VPFRGLVPGGHSAAAAAVTVHSRWNSLEFWRVDRQGVKGLAAVATIILSIPTVLASLYGMNVPLPGQDSPWAFPAILVLAFGLAVALGYIFWKRDWL
jgi:hypothetical protein